LPAKPTDYSRKNDIKAHFTPDKVSTQPFILPANFPHTAGQNFRKILQLPQALAHGPTPPCKNKQLLELRT
jgi:hypothetical protein